MFLFCVCICTVEASTVSGGCADLLLEAKNAGHTKVSISYEHELFDLRATIVIAAYRPLKVSYRQPYQSISQFVKLLFSS